jgi:predicted ATPase/class 3 adenylate cyclase
MTLGTSATLTFLFTDVVRSTTQWERFRAEMAEAVAVHDRLVRSAVVAHGGEIFATGGDGFCVAFASPLDAVAAAAQAQGVLAAQPWPASVELRVRMGLHTGEVEARDRSYFGPAVNRVARLMAVAHGGQVIASGVTAELTRDGLPGGMEWVDLGRHRLKDLTRAEHVFQLSAPGLGAVFPPLRSIDAIATNLPAPRTSFVGRAAELQELEKLVGGRRLVTVTGPGGSGKTRLAVEVGRAMLGDFPDGVWFVDLSPIFDGELVAATAAGAVVGVDSAADRRSPLERLTAALGGWRSLVVIDNCEQVLDAVAELVDRLLGSCLDVRVVATSREPLGVDGEQVWRVPALGSSAGDDASDEAVALFMDRADLADAGFAPDGRQRALIGSVCRRLDGLPLAIELAAARVASLGVDEVARRLDDVFALLVSGQRRTGRQQTLRASILWSYDLLSAPEQTLLQAVSVFAGGFTLAAAEGVSADDTIAAGEIAGWLDHLVQRSLVLAEHAPTGTRYRLLDTIRTFAAEALGSVDRRERLRDAHLRWFAAWSYEEAVGLTNAGLDFSLSEVDNQRLALQWATHRQRPDLLGEVLVDALGGLLSGGLDEPTNYVGVLRAWEPTLDSHGRDLLAFCEACLAEFAGEFAEATRICERQLTTTVDDFMWSKFASVLAANSLWVDPDRALALYDEIERRRGSCLLVTNGRATWALTNRRYDEAVGLFLEALGVSNVSQLASGGSVPNLATGYLLPFLATALHLCARNDDAEAALDHAGRGGPDPFNHFSIMLRAAIQASRADLHGARQLLAASVAAAGRSGLPLAIADCAIGAAAVAYWSGDHGLTSETLAAVRAGGGFRTEASFALYRGYLDRVRAALGDSARPAGAAQPIDEALNRALNTLGVSAG